MSQQVIDVLSSDDEEFRERPPKPKKIRTTSLIRPHVTLTLISNNKNKDQSQDTVMVVSDDEQEAKSASHLKNGQLISSNDDLIILSDDDNEKSNGNQVIDIIDSNTDENTMPQAKKAKKDSPGATMEIAQGKVEKQVEADMDIAGLEHIEIVIEDIPEISNDVYTTNSIIEETKGNLGIDLGAKNQDLLQDKKDNSSETNTNEISSNNDIDGFQVSVSLPLEKLGSPDKPKVDESSNATTLMHANCADNGFVKDDTSSEPNETKQTPDSPRLHQISNNATSLLQDSLSQGKLEAPNERKKSNTSDDVSMLPEINCTDHSIVIDVPSSETNKTNENPDVSLLNVMNMKSDNVLQDALWLSKENLETANKPKENDESINVLMVMDVKNADQGNVLDDTSSETNKNPYNSQLKKISNNDTNSRQDLVSISQETLGAPNEPKKIDESDDVTMLTDINCTDQSIVIDDQSSENNKSNKSPDKSQLNKISNNADSGLQGSVSLLQEKLSDPTEPKEFDKNVNVTTLPDINCADQRILINGPSSESNNSNKSPDSSQLNETCNNANNVLQDSVSLSQEKLRALSQPKEVKESDDVTMSTDITCPDQTILTDGPSSETNKSNKSPDNSQINEISNNGNNAPQGVLSLSQEKLVTLNEPKEIDKSNNVTMLTDINCTDQSIVIDGTSSETNKSSKSPDNSQLNKIGNNAFNVLQDSASLSQEKFEAPKEAKEIDECDDVTMLKDISCAHQSIVIDEPSSETDKSNKSPDNSEVSEISHTANNALQDSVSLAQEKLGAPNESKEIYESDDITMLADINSADQSIAIEDPSSETNKLNKGHDNSQLNEMSNIANNALQDSGSILQEKLGAPNKPKEIDENDDVIMLTDINSTDQSIVIDDPSSQTHKSNKSPDNSQVKEISTIANNELQDAVSLLQGKHKAPNEPKEIDESDDVIMLTDIISTKQSIVIDYLSSETNKSNNSPDNYQLNEIGNIGDIALQDSVSLLQEKFEAPSEPKKVDENDDVIMLMDINSTDQSILIDDPSSETNKSNKSPDNSQVKEISTIANNELQDAVSLLQAKHKAPNEPKEIDERDDVIMLTDLISTNQSIVIDDPSSETNKSNKSPDNSQLNEIGNIGDIALQDSVSLLQEKFGAPSKPKEVDENDDVIMLMDISSTDQSILIDDPSSETNKSNKSPDNSEVNEISNIAKNVLYDSVSLSQEKLGTPKEPKEIDKHDDVTTLTDIHCTEENESDDVIILSDIHFSESIVIDDSDPESDKINKSPDNSQASKTDNLPTNNLNKTSVPLRSTQQSPTIETTTELNESPTMLVEMNPQGSIVINDSDEETEKENVEVFPVNVQKTSSDDVCAPSTSFMVEPAFQEFVKLVEETLIDSPFEELLPNKVPVIQKYFQKCVDHTDKHYFRVLLKDNMEYIRKASVSKAPECAVRAFHRVYTFLKARLEEIEIEIEEDDLPRVKKLEKAMKLLRKRIKELEVMEVDLSDEEDSSYIMLDRYRERFNRVHERYCEYIRKNPYTGRATHDKIAFVNSDYNAINQAISKEYKNSLRFPTYYELLDLIEQVNKEEHLDLSEQEIHKETRACFKNLGTLLQKKRRQELYDLHAEHIEYTEDPATKDPSLERVLKRNNSEGKIKIKEVIEMYAEKQEQIGEQPIPSDEESTISTISSDLYSPWIKPSTGNGSKGEKKSSSRKRKEERDFHTIEFVPETKKRKRKIQLKSNPFKKSAKNTVVDVDPSCSKNAEQEEEVVPIKKAKLQLRKGLKKYKSDSVVDYSSNTVVDGDTSSKEEEHASIHRNKEAYVAQKQKSDSGEKSTENTIDDGDPSCSKEQTSTQGDEDVYMAQKQKSDLAENAVDARDPSCSKEEECASIQRNKDVYVAQKQKSDSAENCTENTEDDEGPSDPIE